LQNMQVCCTGVSSSVSLVGSDNRCYRSVSLEGVAQGAAGGV